MANIERQIWKSAYTRRNAFESPEEMWQVAMKYFEWCDSNPLYISEQSKRAGEDIILPDGTMVSGENLIEIPKKRAYSKSGFCVFAGVSSNFLRLMRYRDRDAGNLEKNKPWIEVLDAIDDVIYAQQFESAAAGQFNATLISRSLGLADKQEVETKIVEVKEVFKIGDKEFEL